jgi:hypothetical protein
MKNLHRELKLPVPFLTKEFDGMQYLSPYQCFNKSDISIEFIDWLSSLNLVLGLTEVFLSKPNTYYRIHQDHTILTDFPKINWVFGKSTSYMNWYTPKTTGFIYTVATGQSVIYEKEDAELLHSVELKSPSLVQAGVPHNITVLKDYRWSISTTYRRNNKLLTYNEMIETLKPFLY